MLPLKILLLGQPDISIGDKPVETDRRKAIALLAYLAVEDKAHRRDALTAFLWPDYPQASAFSYLRRTLWELNQMLGKGWIEADRENVRLSRLPGFYLDVDELGYAIKQNSDHVELLTAAAKLYRGDFLEGLVVADTAPFEDWHTHQAEVYRGEYGRLLEKLVDAYETRSTLGQALTYAQRWLELDKLNEAAWRAIMRQLSGMGDRAGVIRVFQACTQALKDELGVDPQTETEELYKALLHGELVGQPAAEVEKAAASIPIISSIGNLPIPATPFIGRKDEIAQIIHLALEPQVQLLTLTGPGGTGKTRLAIQVAAEIGSSFADGAWFIPLASAQSTQGIISSIADELNFSFYKGDVPQREQLLDYLRKKKLLLVLDNYEHLLEGGRELVADILDSADGVKVLVTSRERLNLQQEQLYRVHGMTTPDLGTIAGWVHPDLQAQAYSSLQLLTTRARRVRPDFELTRENIKPVTEICQLVEGSPLGIELATAWLEVLPEEEIAKEIARNLDFLETDAVDTPTRQRSLRMVFDTSWKLLSTEEQQAFKRLCIFRGSFSRDAAQAVSQASLRTLLNLANKSWLQQIDHGRYHLHEVLKQYGMERLKADQSEWEATNDRQAEFFCAFMEEQAKIIHTAGQIQALQAIKPELESNIPDTWQWLVEQQRIDELIRRVLLGLYYYWLIRGPTIEYIRLLKMARDSITDSANRKHVVRREILECVETSLEANLFVYDDHSKERLKQLWDRVNENKLADELGFWFVVLAATYTNVVNFEEGSLRIQKLLQQVAESGDNWEAANLYLIVGWYADFNRSGRNEDYLQKALAIFRKLGVIQEQGTTLRALGSLASHNMNYERAIEYTTEAQKYYQQVGDLPGLDSTWTRLAEYYIYSGKITEAMHAFEELRQHNERTGNRRFLGTDLSWESLHVARYGSLQTALELRLKSIEIAKEINNLHDLAWATWELGEIYRLMGKIGLARKYFQAALPNFEQMNDFNSLGFYHRSLGDIAFMQGDIEGAQKEFQEALAYHEKEQRGNRDWGLSVIHARLGTVMVELNQLNDAKTHFESSLTFAMNWINPDLMAVPLLGIARWMAAKERYAEAMELAACVASKPMTWNEVKDQAKQVVKEMEANLTAEEASTRVKQGERLAIDEACRRYGKEVSCNKPSRPS